MIFVQMYPQDVTAMYWRNYDSVNYFFIYQLIKNFICILKGTAVFFYRFASNFTDNLNSYGVKKEYIIEELSNNKQLLSVNILLKNCHNLIKKLLNYWYSE